MPNQDPSIAQELLSHQTFLRRLAIDLVGKDADDLVQDVWQRALERPPHHGRQLRGWLARVARNLAANRWRGEARRRSREEGRASAQPAGDELEAPRIGDPSWLIGEGLAHRGRQRGSSQVGGAGESCWGSLLVEGMRADPRPGRRFESHTPARGTPRAAWGRRGGFHRRRGGDPCPC